jgi:hypothetical protein
MKQQILNFVVLLAVSLPFVMEVVQSAIVITKEEKKCLDATGDLFASNDGLIAARHIYAESMEMDMTSASTMTASYPDDPLNSYKSKCTANGGQMHIVKIDFFDCTLRKMNREVELTLKNFANCLAAIPECKDFDQENLLEEAWEDMGLHCILEDGPSNGGNSNNNNSKNTPAPKPVRADDDGYAPLDDDLANQEKEEEEAAKKGASDEAVPYVPKEEMGRTSSRSNNQKTKKKKSGLWTFMMFVAVGGGVFYMHKQGRLPGLGGRRGGYRGQLPWGGVTTSRFQERGPAADNPNMFSTSYNLVAGEEEFNFVPSVDNELQLSANMTA